jgi:hypothetical protein
MKHLKTFEAFVKEDLVKQNVDTEDAEKTTDVEDVNTDAGADTDKKENPEAEKIAAAETDAAADATADADASDETEEETEEVADDAAKDAGD